MRAGVYISVYFLRVQIQTFGMKKKPATPRELMDLRYTLTNTTRKELVSNHRKDPEAKKKIHPDTFVVVICENCSRVRKEGDQYLECEKKCCVVYCSESCREQDSKKHRVICCPELEEIREVFCQQLLETMYIAEDPGQYRVFDPVLSSGKGYCVSVDFVVGEIITPLTFAQTKLRINLIEDLKPVLTPGQYHILEKGSVDKKYLVMFCVLNPGRYYVHFLSWWIDDEMKALDEEIAKKRREMLPSPSSSLLKDGKNEDFDHEIQKATKILEKLSMGMVKSSVEEEEEEIKSFVKEFDDNTGGIEQKFTEEISIKEDK
jgi:hypothetical protein